MSENAQRTITLVQSWLKTNCVKHCKNLRTLLRSYVGYDVYLATFQQRGLDSLDTIYH